MKKYFLLITILFTFIYVKAQTNMANQISQLVSEIINIDSSNLNKNNPIRSINIYAKQYADSIIYLDKKNMNESLIKAKKYKYAILTVEEHTVLKIIDFNKEVLSGSWELKCLLVMDT